jgi:hypothetical protein
MAIVQQGRKQRHRRRHPAATLGQRERRIFMAQQFGQLHMRPPYTAFHAFLAYLYPHRQRIDEQSQRPIRTFPPLHPP